MKILIIKDVNVFVIFSTDTFNTTTININTNIKILNKFTNNPPPARLLQNITDIGGEFEINDGIAPNIAKLYATYAKICNPKILLPIKGFATA